MNFVQRNVTLDKTTTRLNLAGVSTLAPILSGFHASASLQLYPNENLKQIKVYNNSGFENILSYTISGNVVTVPDITFGTDTAIGRNYIEWTTSNGVASQQFYVAELPYKQCLYINNQEAQYATAYLYKEDNPTYVRNNDISFSINILPHLSDEFFLQQWYDSNAWANTLRHYGGAQTAEVFLDGTQIIPETPIAKVYGYYWIDPTYGYHTIEVKLRAITDSSYSISIHGNIRVRQLES